MALGRKDSGSLAALLSAEAYFFDLDGCVYHTDRPAPGARELLDLLEQGGKRIGFITNNSRETGAEIAAKLLGMGIPAEAKRIVTATEAVGTYVKERFGAVRVKVAGSASLARAVEQCGHTVLDFDDETHPDVIVVGRDTAFTFAKLQRIADEVTAGAAWITANPDTSHPGPGGRRIAETGALAAAIEAVTGQASATAGKPEPFLFAYARRALGLTTQRCAMIGDNLLTDIAGGRAAGMTTVRIGTVGDGGPPTAEADIRVDSMAELLQLYERNVTTRRESH